MLVVTSDAFRFTVPDGVAHQCGTLRVASEAAEVSGDARSVEGPEPAVPVPNVSSANMTRIVKFYMRLEELEGSEEEPAAVAAWKITFFESLDRGDLFQLLEAANFLDASVLLDDACAYVADLIRGCSPNKIREILLLPHDLTSEQSRQLAAEFAWALQ